MTRMYKNEEEARKAAEEFCLQLCCGHFVVESHNRFNVWAEGDMDWLFAKFEFDFVPGYYFFWDQEYFSNRPSNPWLRWVSDRMDFTEDICYERFKGEILETGKMLVPSDEAFAPGYYQCWHVKIEKPVNPFCVWRNVRDPEEEPYTTAYDYEAVMDCNFELVNIDWGQR